MGQGKMFFMKQKTRLPWKKDWEKQSTHKCAHTSYPHSQHTACGKEEEEGGWQRCEEEGLFPHALYSHSNHPICCNHSPL